MTVPLIAAPSVNECEGVLSASYTRGTDTTISMTDGAIFPNPTPLGHVARISSGDKFALIVYDDKTDADTLSMDAATDYAKAVNLGGGAAAAEVFPIGSTVELVCAADEIAQEMNSAIHRDVSGEIVAVTEKTAPIGADEFLIEDSASSNAKKSLKFSNTPLSILKEAVTTKTSIATLTIAEAGTVLVSCAATPYTITLPTAVGNDGLRYHFIKTDANYFLITLAANGAQTFNYESSTGAPVTTYPRLNTYCAEVTVVSDGTNWQCINERMGQKPMAKVYLSADQLNLVNNTFTTLVLDAEVYDIGSNFDTGNYKFVIPIPGKYRVYGMLSWLAASFAADSRYYARLYNGAAAISNSVVQSSVANQAMSQSTEVLAAFSASDEIYFKASQNSGGDLVDVDGGLSYVTYLDVYLIAKD